MGADQRDQLAQEQRQVDVVERQIGVGGDQLADVAGQGRGGPPLAPDAERVERTEHALGVLGHQADQQVGDPLANAGVELAEHAVVERGDHPAGQHAEVARVRVGVEEAEAEDLGQQDPRPAGGDVRRIDPHPPQALQVVHPDPLDELHAEHAAGRVLREDLRNVGVRHHARAGCGSAPSSAARCSGPARA